MRYHPELTKRLEELYTKMQGKINDQETLNVCLENLVQEIDLKQLPIEHGEIDDEFILWKSTELFTVAKYIYKENLTSVKEFALKVFMNLFENREIDGELRRELEQLFKEYQINPCIHCPYCGHFLTYSDKGNCTSRYVGEKCVYCGGKVTVSTSGKEWLIFVFLFFLGFGLLKLFQNIWIALLPFFLYIILGSRYEYYHKPLKKAKTNRCF